MPLKSIDLAGDLTPVGLHKLRRDIAIAALARIGATVEFLADVHDLDPASVRRILRAYRTEPWKKQERRNVAASES